MLEAYIELLLQGKPVILDSDPIYYSLSCDEERFYYYRGGLICCTLIEALESLAYELERFLFKDEAPFLRTLAWKLKNV